MSRRVFWDTNLFVYWLAGTQPWFDHVRAPVSACALVVPFAAPAARAYARLRRDRGLRAPDAIQLACAAAAGCDLFITNDRRLQSRRVPGVGAIVALDDAPLPRASARE